MVTVVLILYSLSMLKGLEHSHSQLASPTFDQNCITHLMQQVLLAYNECHGSLGPPSLIEALIGRSFYLYQLGAFIQKESQWDVIL
jgi:hypothetical protein